MIAVYVPAPGSALGIVDGSGIVGSPWEGGPTVIRGARDRVLIDYEGNLYGAVGMGRYANRVSHAWGRHVMSYPTTARMVVDASELVQVGLFDPNEGVVTVIRGTEWELLRQWLGVDTIDPDELVRR